MNQFCFLRYLLLFIFSLSIVNTIFAQEQTLISIENPVCGVLTTQGYIFTESELNFLLPTSAQDSEVKRYSVAPGSTVMPPIDVVASWWACVTDGILTEGVTDAHGTLLYGSIVINDMKYDQSTGERGQE